MNQRQLSQSREALFVLFLGMDSELSPSASLSSPPSEPESKLESSPLSASEPNSVASPLAESEPASSSPLSDDSAY
ncbi:hypothetical protein LOK49_LG08G00856 [Camellia lanceoleosa]|uniref:Uncharacterized protein n=1 Tax=Camellia lanceoleosa TaxID=1840588 RepID=A0ACC0GQS0_9ERIC|nr:hypothetical protein LOK49_LG08G00856 [Camellia lanceoleosa]